MDGIKKSTIFVAIAFECCILGVTIIRRREMKTIILMTLLLALSACGDNHFSSRNPMDSGVLEDFCDTDKCADGRE